MSTRGPEGKTLDFNGNTCTYKISQRLCARWYLLPFWHVAGLMQWPLPGGSTGV